MKRMKDLDRQEKEYYEKLHKEVVHQDTPSEEIEKEVDETEKQDAAQEETTKQERFQLVNPDEIDFPNIRRLYLSVPNKTPSKSLTLMITVHKVQLTETVAPPGRRMRKTQERQPVFG